MNVSWRGRFTVPLPLGAFLRAKKRTLSVHAVGIRQRLAFLMLVNLESFLMTVQKSSRTIVCAAIIAASSFLALSGASAEPFGGRNGGVNSDGAVYVMPNKLDGNTIVAYTGTQVNNPD